MVKIYRAGDIRYSYYGIYIKRSDLDNVRNRIAMKILHDNLERDNIRS